MIWLIEALIRKRRANGLAIESKDIGSQSEPVPYSTSENRLPGQMMHFHAN